MNQDTLRQLQNSLVEASRWLLPLAILWLLGSLGLGGLIKLSLVAVGILLLTPVVLFLGLRWWLKRNLVQDSCPVCNYEFVGLEHAQLRCPNCSEALMVENRHFRRLAPPSTIDVNAVEVSAQQIED